LELRGRAETKPFECVGTVSEVELALTHAQDGFYEELLMKEVEKAKDKTELKLALQEWNNEHSLPIKFENILKEYLRKCTN
jgi:transposase